MVNQYQIEKSWTPYILIIEKAGFYEKMPLNGLRLLDTITPLWYLPNIALKNRNKGRIVRLLVEDWKSGGQQEMA